MPGVSYSIELSVDERLIKYIKAVNKERHDWIVSRTEAIADLLQKAGF